MSQKIYIAGPMSGKKNLNFDAFDHAKEFLQGAGWIVVSPADITRLMHGWVQYPPAEDVESLHRDALTKEQRWEIIHLDLAALASCDAIFLLHGWDESPGATAEIALATFLGHELHYAEDSYREEDVVDNSFVGPPDLREDTGTADA